MLFWTSSRARSSLTWRRSRLSRAASRPHRGGDPDTPTAGRSGGSTCVSFPGRRDQADQMEIRCVGREEPHGRHRRPPLTRYHRQHPVQQLRALWVRALGVTHAGQGRVGSGPTLTRRAGLQRRVRSCPMRNRVEPRNPTLTIDIRGAAINPSPPCPATVMSPAPPSISTS